VKAVMVDALIREIGALTSKRGLDLEPMDEKAQEATGVASEG
jgi:hypothetical protein